MCEAAPDWFPLEDHYHLLKPLILFCVCMLDLILDHFYVADTACFEIESWATSS